MPAVRTVPDRLVEIYGAWTDRGVLKEVGKRRLCLLEREDLRGPLQSHEATKLLHSASGIAKLAYRVGRMDNSHSHQPP